VREACWLLGLGRLRVQDYIRLDMGATRHKGMRLGTFPPFFVCVWNNPPTSGTKRNHPPPTIHHPPFTIHHSEPRWELEVTLRPDRARWATTGAWGALGS
jgi:hypothetical protein